MPKKTTKLKIEVFEEDDENGELTGLLSFEGVVAEVDRELATQMTKAAVAAALGVLRDEKTQRSNPLPVTSMPFGTA